MDRDCSFERLRIYIKDLHGQQAASRYNRCSHLVDSAPAIKAAVRMQNQIKKFSHGYLLNFDRQPIISGILDAFGRPRVSGYDPLLHC
jgi:hypothetical protein